MVISEKLQQLCDLGVWIQSNRWCPATSGNLSARATTENTVNKNHFWISVSGKYKGELQPEDFIEVDEQGSPLQADRKPSAETLLHALIYQQFPDAGFVLHTHSIYGTVLSQFHKNSSLVFHDYELQKAFTGIDTHEGELHIPVFANSQDMVALSGQIKAHFNECELIHGFMLAGHGVYTWGKTAQDAKRHLEALEFLFECEYRWRLLAQRLPPITIE